MEMELPQDAGLVGLLGPRLLSQSGQVDTMDAVGGKGAIALYFSAHWCPPCRGFTPQFAESYKTSLKAKGLEVVFISSDKNMAEFKKYFGEMPWLAIPFDDRARKEALSKRFKVQGIPTVVVLGADGKVITKDGRSVISGDPTGDEFPWQPKPLKDVMAGARLIGPGGAEHGVEAVEGKVFALYFSAHWCPPCRGFTPELAQWYSKSLHAKGLEVIFVSSDRDENSFKEYFGEMPWLALDYSDRKRKAQLSNMFGVSGIPSIVIIGPDGNVITKEGREAVSSDPEGTEFPWYPKPVTDLKSGPGSLEEVPTIIAFCESSTPEVKRAAEDAMMPLAQQYLDMQKMEGEEDPKYAFRLASEAGGIAARLREIMSVPPSTQTPRLMLIDIPDNGAFYSGPEGEITNDVVAKFVADYESKTLTRQQLRTS